MVDTTITAERVLTPDGWLDRARLEVRDGLIVDISSLPASIVADHHVVAPGFIDIQVNGVAHIDVATADGDEWDHVATDLASTGTTSWCPTLVTRPLDDYPAAWERLGRALRRDMVGAQIVGVHLEGPFLGARHGAHPSRSVVPIDLDVCRGLPPFVRLVTLGPELAGAVEATRELTARGVVVAIGHTEADDDQIEQVVVAGARLVTHVFNAMSGVHHRDGGVALFALTDDRLAVSLIADGVHVAPRAMSLVWRARPDGVVLVTDSVAWARPGLSVADGAPRLADGTLAGSRLTMDAAIRNCVALGVPLEAGLTAASTRPASLLGLRDRGAITVGLRADLVALDHDLRPVITWVSGRPSPAGDR